MPGARPTLLPIAVMRLLLAVLLAGLCAAPAQAQFADPRPDWHSAESAHFRVHYRTSQRAQAEAVVRAAERAWPKVTESMKWEPKSRIELMLFSEFDIANGYSTPLPYNLIGVFLTPPDEGELLDNSAWLDLLMVHELTHAVHMDKMRGAARVLHSIFGRLLWLVPNLFNPGWVMEGLAVSNESDPATGRGRLKGPMFEAWLRAERKNGFLKLAELNADGRALPVSKQYLYGAYFFEFMARRYGADKPQQMVEYYSGNVLAPRLHSAPYGATGKTMDVLWDEFLADLAQQVGERAAAVERSPEVAGRRVLGPIFDLPTLGALPSGAVLAVVDDGLNAAAIERIARDGTRRHVARAKPGARLEVGRDGRALVMQLDLCDTYYYAYDLYRLEGDSLKRLTRCAHLRRAVQAESGIVAVQLQEGRTRLVRLANDGRGEPVVLYAPAADDAELIDIAVAPDGRTLSAVVRQAGDWRLLEFDLSRPGAAPLLRLRHGAPLYGLRHGHGGLEMLSGEGGTLNVWRYAEGRLQRLTHAHTGVVAHGGSAVDGSMAVVVVAAQGYELRWLDALAVQETRSASTGPAPAPLAAAAPGSAPVAELGRGQPYSAWRTMYPRYWFPATFADRGLTAFGASTSGADAAGWHQYFVYGMWETSQKEFLGGVEYVWRGAHGLAIDRSLTARGWTGGDGDEETTLYDRHLQAQWLSLLPVPGLNSLQRRVTVGVGAALDRIDRVVVANGARSRREDQRLVALLADWDTRAANWYSDGANRGLKLTLRAESHKPFDPDTTDAVPDLDGTMVRADLRGYLGIGRGVLALRLTEARAKDRIAPFQLGGATEAGKAIGFNLGNRELPLRGYKGDEPQLLGREARLASLEWRMPLADIDRHGMVPPLGINRLAGTFFFDTGGAWNTGNGPTQYYRGVGFELRGETKLLYVLGLDLRLGVGHALDPIAGRGRTRGWLTAQQSF